ncbi:GDSL esterase/lipase [Canna indica]|uniref:GDSL esterase/lipase n=1 Tax=Canna indica TaxID=4628 RepID=A0AAQ3KRL2_9LILI|nr:GDSL esterase/lipase [Canna indica]
MRPAGAPRVVLALRGTLLKSPTIRRDLVDDLRFLAWESLKGSVRFHGALEALSKMVERFGSKNVCVGGHSLGAGFALQVGKALAKQDNLSKFKSKAEELEERYIKVQRQVEELQKGTKESNSKISELQDIIQKLETNLSVLECENKVLRQQTLLGSTNEDLSECKISTLESDNDLLLNQQKINCQPTYSSEVIKPPSENELVHDQQLSLIIHRLEPIVYPTQVLNVRVDAREMTSRIFYGARGILTHSCYNWLSCHADHAPTRAN